MPHILAACWQPPVPPPNPPGAPLPNPYPPATELPPMEETPEPLN